MRSNSSSKLALTSLLSDERGVVMVLTAVTLPLIILIIAFSMVTSMAAAEHNRMQAAADYAARYASLVYAQSYTPELAIIAARAHTKSNGYVHDGTDTIVDVKFSAPGFSHWPNVVAVEITKTDDIVGFASDGLFGTQFTQKVRGVAGGASVPCLVALNPAAGNTNVGIRVSGAGSYLKANCPIFSNKATDPTSNNDYSITTNGLTATSYDVCNDPAFTGTPFCAASFNVAGQVNTADFDSSALVLEETIQIDYLLSNIPFSPPSTTPASNVISRTTFKNQFSRTVSSVTLDTSKIYDCIDLGSGEEAVIPTGGTLYVRGINMGSGALLKGSGATIVILGNSSATSQCWGSSSTKDPLRVQSGATISVTAPTSGPFQNVAIIEHPGVKTACVAQAGANCTITGSVRGGSGSGGISGIVALPNFELTLSGGSAPSGGCQSYWAWEITINGGSNMGEGCRTKKYDVASMKGSALLE